MWHNVDPIHKLLAKHVLQPLYNCIAAIVNVGRRLGSWITYSSYLKLLDMNNMYLLLKSKRNFKKEIGGNCLDLVAVEVGL